MLGYVAKGNKVANIKFAYQLSLHSGDYLEYTGRPTVITKVFKSGRGR